MPWIIVVLAAVCAIAAIVFIKHKICAPPGLPGAPEDIARQPEEAAQFEPEPDFEPELEPMPEPEPEPEPKP